MARFPCPRCARDRAALTAQCESCGWGAIALDSTPGPAGTPQSIADTKAAGRPQDLDPSDSSGLAPRSARLGAIIIDALVTGLVTVPILIATGTWQKAMSGVPLRATDAGALQLIGWFLFLLINGHGLMTRGQTIGKRVLRIRIVDRNGNIPSLLTVVFARYMVPGVITAFPLLGPLIGLAGILLIFGASRRCLHDYMAGTHVVDSRESREFSAAASPHAAAGVVYGFVGVLILFLASQVGFKSLATSINVSTRLITFSISVAAIVLVANGIGLFTGTRWGHRLATVTSTAAMAAGILPLLARTRDGGIGVNFVALSAGASVLFGFSLVVLHMRSIRGNAGTGGVSLLASALLGFTAGLPLAIGLGAGWSAGASPAAIRAAQSGDWREVKALLAETARSQTQDANGASLLAFATGNTGESHDPGAIEALLRAGADVHERFSDGRTALIETAEWAEPALVDLLIARGAKAAAHDQAGGTALSRAIGRTDVGAAAVVRRLIAEGATIEPAPLQSPLRTAAAAGRADLVKALLAAGANVNAADERGLTPLMLAARGAQRAVLEALLAADADTRVADAQGQTAIDWAVQGDVSLDRALVVERLAADAGSVARVRQSAAYQALVSLALYSAADAQAADRIQRLLVAGAHPNARLPDRRYSVLSRVVAIAADSVTTSTTHPSLECVRLLLAAGAAVRAEDLPLHRYAAPRSRDWARAMTKLLLSARPDLNVALDTLPTTPLLYAAVHGETELAELLIASGARTDMVEPSGGRDAATSAEKAGYPQTAAAIRRAARTAAPAVSRR